MSWIIGLLTRFVPSLLPAIGGFLNPWILLAIGGAIVGAFLYGLSIGHDRLEAFEAKVAAIGEVQEARTKARIVADKALKERIDREHEKALSDLSTSITALVKRLSVDPGGSVLPAIPAGAAVPDIIRFDRAELDGALRAFTSGAALLIGEGARYGIDLACGARWVQEQQKSGP